MAIPSNFLTGLLNSAETPDEKYELLKQFGYLSAYGLKNCELFIEVVLNSEKFTVDSSGYDYDPNPLSYKLASEGFLNAKFLAIFGSIAIKILISLSFSHPLQL